MKCVYHPKKDAVALLPRFISKKLNLSEGEMEINFQVGVCRRCLDNWVENKEKDGYE